MSNIPQPVPQTDRIGSVLPSAVDGTAVGPVHPVSPPDLFAAGTAASDQRYTLAPREHDAWQFAVTQAGQTIAACGQNDGAQLRGDDGPYSTGTGQGGVPVYGMAGGQA